MRPYNSETDYHLIVESVARIEGEKSLATIARDLKAAGIAWPLNMQEEGAGRGQEEGRHPQPGRGGGSLFPTTAGDVHPLVVLSGYETPLHSQG